MKRIGVVAVVLLGVVTTVVWGMILTGSPGKEAVASVATGEPLSGTRSPAQGTGRPRMSVIGDSLSGGSAVGGQGSNGWPAMVGSELNWEVTNSSIGGTGYVNGGERGTPFGTQISTAVSAAPDVILVVGGRNDVGLSVNDVESAARMLFGGIAALAPNSRVVVVGIMWTDSPLPVVEATNDAVRRAAVAAAVPFVDALNEDWLRPEDIGSDGVHPTDAGHRTIATRIIGALTGLGLVEEHSH